MQHLIVAFAAEFFGSTFFFCSAHSVAFTKERSETASVAERDENTEAVRNVEKTTDSEPVQGEDLLKSDKLKRKLSEAKKRIESESEESEESSE